MRSVNCMRFYEFSQVPKKCIQQVAVLSLCNSNYIIIIYEVSLYIYLSQIRTALFNNVLGCCLLLGLLGLLGLRDFFSTSNLFVDVSKLSCSLFLKLSTDFFRSTSGCRYTRGPLSIWSELKQAMGNLWHRMRLYLMASVRNGAGAAWLTCK